MTHTPGPWTVRDDLEITPGGSQCIVAPQANGKLIVIAEAWTCDDTCKTPRHEPISQANARLIAAAPALLEALEAMLPENFTPNNWLASRKLALDQARAAITLARGEEVTA